MNSFAVNAIVLRRAEWRDYDRMVTLFTPDLGRLDAVARGCRKPKSPLLNAVEPFTCGEYQIVRIRDRNTIDQCHITEDFYDLRTDYERLTHGAYWLKLLEEIVMPDEPNPNLFHMTLNALAYLAHSDLPPKLLTAMFEMQLWNDAGFAPNTTECVLCHSVSNLRFDAVKGGCVCVKCCPGAKPLSEGARRILMKAPRAKYETVELLNEHPDWPEAAKRIREFTLARLNHEINTP